MMEPAAPDGFGWAVALLALAVVLVPLTSRTLFQAGGQSAKKVVSLLFKQSVAGLLSEVRRKTCSNGGNLMPRKPLRNGDHCADHRKKLMQEDRDCLVVLNWMRPEEHKCDQKNTKPG